MIPLHLRYTRYSNTWCNVILFKDLSLFSSLSLCTPIPTQCVLKALWGQIIYIFLCTFLFNHHLLKMLNGYINQTKWKRGEKGGLSGNSWFAKTSKKYLPEALLQVKDIKLDFAHKRTSSIMKEKYQTNLNSNDVNSPNTNLELLYYKGKGGANSCLSIVIVMKSMGKIGILRGSKSIRS